LGAGTRHEFRQRNRQQRHRVDHRLLVAFSSGPRSCGRCVLPRCAPAPGGSPIGVGAVGQECASALGDDRNLVCLQP
jgi:hypothetical protein